MSIWGAKPQCHRFLPRKLPAVWSGIIKGQNIPSTSMFQEIPSVAPFDLIFSSKKNSYTPED